MRKVINEFLANRVREKLIHLTDVEEKFMFSGLVFLVNGKLCIGVGRDQLLVRLNPEDVEEFAERNGVTQMTNGKAVMKGYFFVNENVLQSDWELNFWIDKALEFNPIAKVSKKKRKEK